MSLLSKIGTKASLAVASSTPTLKKAGIGAALTVSAGVGFAKGFKSSGANEAFYEMTTGNPTIDQDVLGTSLTPMQALMPMPFGKVDRALYGMPFARSGTPRLMAALSTGLVNSKTAGAAFTGANHPFVEPRNSYSPNAFPSVDGSIVFGMNNARFG